MRQAETSSRKLDTAITISTAQDTVSGTEVHEAPTLNPKSEEVLEEYMPVTVEPGIYIPDKFGVRIEDLAIITEFGIINAVKSQKSLIII